MSHVTNVNIYIKSEIALNRDVQALKAQMKEHPAPLRDQLVAKIEAAKLGAVFMEYFTMTNLAEVDDLDDLECCSSLTFRSQDPDNTVNGLAAVTKGTELEGTFEVVVGETYKDPDGDDRWKSIEIYYDVADIPDGYAHPLDFRNEAMELIETALANADAGEWQGAESGANLETGEPEVNFGFDVEDFERAEKIVRASVKGTPFDCIREIARFDSEADLPPGTLPS